MDSVKDKVVLITGSSRGIGAVTAVLFAKYGSRLVLTGRDQVELNSVVEQCVAVGLNKEKILSVTADATVDAELEELLTSAIAKFGTLHILVNNAAMSSIGTVQETSMEECDLVYRANLRAPIYLTKLAIPYLKQNKGSVINVSTVLAVSPKADRTLYCIFKAGLDMFAKNLTLELAADGVRVNTIRPGYAHSGRHSRQIGIPDDSEQAKGMYKDLSRQTPFGRLGTCEECAQAIVFLASDASSFTTGAFLDVDGGLLQTSAWTQPSQ